MRGERGGGRGEGGLFIICLLLLSAGASEQGNVIGSVRIYIYIYMCTIFFCN